VHLVLDTEAEHRIVLGYRGNQHKICVSCTCLHGCAPLAVAVRLPAKQAIAAFKAHLAGLADQR
jgi:hypothetical protein